MRSVLYSANCIVFSFFHHDTNICIYYICYMLPNHPIFKHLHLCTSLYPFSANMSIKHSVLPQEKSIKLRWEKMWPVKPIQITFVQLVAEHSVFNGLQFNICSISFPPEQLGIQVGGMQRVKMIFE